MEFYSYAILAARSLARAAWFLIVLEKARPSVTLLSSYLQCPSPSD